ncbi:MAG: hypothetical protein ABSH53_22635 [Holophaga sp.]|jgi:hypothetical protein
MLVPSNREASVRHRLLQALFSAALLAGCRRETPEARIRKAFDACV